MKVYILVASIIVASEATLSNYYYKDNDGYMHRWRYNKYGVGGDWIQEYLRGTRDGTFPSDGRRRNDRSGSDWRFMSYRRETYDSGNRDDYAVRRHDRRSRNNGYQRDASNYAGDGIDSRNGLNKFDNGRRSERSGMHRGWDNRRNKNDGYLRDTSRYASEDIDSRDRRNRYGNSRRSGMHREWDSRRNKGSYNRRRSRYDRHGSDYGSNSMYARDGLHNDWRREKSSTASPPESTTDAPDTTLPVTTPATDPETTVKTTTVTDAVITTTTTTEMTDTVSKKTQTTPPTKLHTKHLPLLRRQNIGPISIGSSGNGIQIRLSGPYVSAPIIYQSFEDPSKRHRKKKKSRKNKRRKNNRNNAHKRPDSNKLLDFNVPTEPDLDDSTAPDSIGPNGKNGPGPNGHSTDSPKGRNSNILNSQSTNGLNTDPDGTTSRNQQNANEPGINVVRNKRNRENGPRLLPTGRDRSSNDGPNGPRSIQRRRNGRTGNNNRYNGQNSKRNGRPTGRDSGPRSIQRRRNGRTGNNKRYNGQNSKRNGRPTGRDSGPRDHRKDYLQITTERQPRYTDIENKPQYRSDRRYENRQPRMDGYTHEPRKERRRNEDYTEGGRRNVDRRPGPRVDEYEPRRERRYDDNASVRTFGNIQNGRYMRPILNKFHNNRWFELNPFDIRRSMIYGNLLSRQYTDQHMPFGVVRPSFDGRFNIPPRPWIFHSTL